MVASANGNKPSLYESLRHTSAATLLENLQSQLKQKEGEIVQLQVPFQHKFLKDFFLNLRMCQMNLKFHIIQ